MHSSSLTKGGKEGEHSTLQRMWKYY